MAMLLGQEGEAFFLREAFEDEATESIGNVSSSYRNNAADSNSGGAAAAQNANNASLLNRSEGPKD